MIRYAQGTLLGLELGSLGRPARSRTLYRLHYGALAKEKKKIRMNKRR
jgi:hypothetical protein